MSFETSKYLLVQSTTFLKLKCPKKLLLNNQFVIALNARLMSIRLNLEKVRSPAACSTIQDGKEASKTQGSEAQATFQSLLKTGFVKIMENVPKISEGKQKSIFSELHL